ncbi:transketolase, partial [Pseudoxanthomonas sp. SGD-10]
STSGSHERYKSKERLAWEKEYDCIAQMRKWMLESAISTDDELGQVEEEIKNEVKALMKEAWTEFLVDVKQERNEALDLLENLGEELPEVKRIALMLRSEIEPLRKEIFGAVRKALRISRNHQSQAKSQLSSWLAKQKAINADRYNSGLFSNTALSPLKVEEVKPIYSEDSRVIDGKDVLNACFEANFRKNPLLVAFGEDLGKIGDVNQGFAGLQAKFGEIRISDTGIREMTIMGQGLGLALRGFRPIAEIQYLDYLLFGLNVLSDDLATLSYRTKVGQIAPMIVRTRGHRLEGIWHSGSPMGMILGSLRGIHLCVPRDMTQAAGMYNTLLKGDEPALMVESLNGYRLKERLPDNIGDFTVPLGKVDILKVGKDITIVSYGSTLKQVMEGVEELSALGIDAEVIDVQTLMPFDLSHDCVQSLQKTNKLLIVDEDVPGGASAYIMQQILENQNGYYYLDAKPATLT